MGGVIFYGWNDFSILPCHPEFVKSDFLVWSAWRIFLTKKLKKQTPVVEVKNRTLCELITQKVCFLDFEVLPADKL
jgi:hypothetical protein